MFLLRFTVTSRRALNSCFLWALRSRIRSFLARFRSRIVADVVDAGRAALARVADACRGARLTAELARGFTFAYDCRCRFCAAETLRCAPMLLPVFAGRAARTCADCCCGLALSCRLFLSVAACAPPPAASASAKIPIHTECRIYFLFFPHFSVLEIRPKRVTNYSTPLSILCFTLSGGLALVMKPPRVMSVMTTDPASRTRNIAFFDSSFCCHREFVIGLGKRFL